MMNITQTLQTHILALPSHIQAEVLDFVEYLEQKHGVGLAANKNNDLQTAAFIQRVACSLGDDFPDDIDSTDLGEDSIKDFL